ncbi:tyrosine-type recombinase/integrase [Brevibacillus choshinensis]|uniref:tyrosine-type recombinase/integrase n=1 Tax=Brevibacillus choshinensis TaxID=54911 RepID=UPI002E9DD38C|nr:site-specific integrase [Brevibacillus choshinensis]
MHKDAVNTLLEGLEKQLGFKLYPHKLRHTFCSRLLKRGVPLTMESKLAGHAHIQTTFQITIRNPCYLITIVNENNSRKCRER